MSVLASLLLQFCATDSHFFYPTIRRSANINVLHNSNSERQLNGLNTHGRHSRPCSCLLSVFPSFSHKTGWRRTMRTCGEIHTTISTSVRLHSYSSYHNQRWYMYSVLHGLRYNSTQGHAGMSPGTSTSHWQSVSLLDPSTYDFCTQNIAKHWVEAAWFDFFALPYRNAVSTGVCVPCVCACETGLQRNL